MKIRLIQPAQLDKNGEPIRFKKVFMPALSLPTIAALTPKEVDVGITVDYIDKIDFDEDVDLVGITSQTCQAPRAYQIAAEFRKRGKKTIMGGIHASALPEEALKHFDSVLIGEAEDIWEQIIKDLKSNNLRRIYKSSKRPDLSRLVIPRYDLLDFKNYVIPPFAKTPCLPIQATRGCPNQCDFCSVSPFWGQAIRTKPVEHVVKEIEAFKPSLIFLSDDNIGANTVYAKKLFKALKPLKVRWAAQMSTTVIKDPELIELAAEAGCYEIFLGVESLDENVLKSINKGFNKISEYGKVFKRFEDAGIHVQIPVLFGFDEDTPDNLKKVTDIVFNWNVSYMYFFFLTPFPGTKIYQQLKSENRIIEEDWSLYDTINPVFRFKNSNAKELTKIMWNSYDEFYSPRNIVKRHWRMKKQYISFFPRASVFEDVFYSFLIQNSVKKRKHPFTMGLEEDK